MRSCVGAHAFFAYEVVIFASSSLAFSRLNLLCLLKRMSVRSVEAPGGPEALPDLRAAHYVSALGKVCAALPALKTGLTQGPPSVVQIVRRVRFEK